MPADALEHARPDEQNAAVRSWWGDAYIVGILFLFSQIIHVAITTQATVLVMSRGDIDFHTKGIIFSWVSIFNLLIQVAIIFFLYVIVMKIIKNKSRIYFRFSGRISRKANFYYVIVPLIILTVVYLLIMLSAMFTMMAQPDALQSYVATLLPVFAPVCFLGLALIWPNLATKAKRAHDIGLSAWWLLLGLLPFVGIIFDLVLWFTPGQKRANRFGSDPLS